MASCFCIIIVVMAAARSGLHDEKGGICFYLRRSTQVYKWHRKKWSKGKGGSDIESNGKGGYIEHLQFRERRVHKSSKTWYSIKEERDYYLKSSKL